MPIIYPKGQEPKYTTPAGVETAGKSLEQFQNTPYYDLAKSYYDGLSAQWKQGNGLEFITHRAEDFNSQLLQGYYSDINNLLSTMHQPDFNSDAMKAEAQTMQGLGINADLHGLPSPNAGDAPQSDAQEMPKKGNDLMPFVNMVTQGLSIGFELYSKTQGLNSVRLDNDMKQMSLTNAIEKWASDWWSDNPSFNEDADVMAAIDAFLNSFGSHLSSKTSKQLPGIFSRAKAKISTQIKHNELTKKEVTSRASKVGAQSFFGEDTDPMDAVMKDIIDPIIKMQYDLMEVSNSSDIARSSYDARYYRDLDPAKKADADNTENDFLSSDFDIKKNIQSTMREITTNLVRTSRSGNWAQRTFADSLLVGMWMTSAMNFNVSAGGLISKVIK